MLTQLSNEIAEKLSGANPTVTQASIKFNSALAALDLVDPDNVGLGELTRIHRLLQEGIKLLDKIR